MRSLDTNILLYSLNADCQEFGAARQLVQDLASADDVLICDLVLVELYLLLRNPEVLTRPLSAKEAVETCLTFRNNPRWRVVEGAAIMNSVWPLAAHNKFPRRRIIDARLALTLRHHGVTEWITRNIADFQSYGFTRVWHPFRV